MSNEKDAYSHFVIDFVELCFIIRSSLFVIHNCFYRTFTEVACTWRPLPVYTSSLSEWSE